MTLIPDWRNWWRFWSIRLQLAGVFILSLLEGLPDAAIATLAVLPPDIRAQINPEHIRYIGYAILTTGIIARLIRQPKLHAGAATR